MLMNTAVLPKGVGLAFLLLFLLMAGMANGQCTPDPSIPQPGTYPSPIPGGSAGVPYSQTIDLVSRGDTVYLSLLTPFDSIEISSVTLPPGLSFICSSNPNPCMYYPPSVGDAIRMCLSLDGTPTQNIDSNIVLGLILTKWVTVVGQPEALSDTTGIPFGPAVGLRDQIKPLFTDVRLSPNPSTGLFYLSGESSVNALVTLRVVDLHGRVVLASAPQRLGQTFELPVDLSGQVNGLFFVQLISEGRSASWKVMVE